MVMVPAEKVSNLVERLRTLGSSRSGMLGAGYRDAADMLENLVENEIAEMEEYYEEQRMVERYEDEEWGRLEMENAAIEKSLQHCL